MNQFHSKCYSIIPAAGRSRRMGCQKLLLPWPKTETPAEPARTVLDSVLSAWSNSQVDQIAVVFDSLAAETADGRKLIEICQNYRVHVVQTLQPVDMKASVMAGMEFLEQKFHPEASDQCFISPADLPTLRCELINQLANQKTNSQQVCLPIFNGKRGHPALMDWELLQRVRELGENEGINKIVENSEALAIHIPGEWNATDIDTPEDYQNLVDSQESPS